MHTASSAAHLWHARGLRTGDHALPILGCAVHSITASALRASACNAISLLALPVYAFLSPHSASGGKRRRMPSAAGGYRVLASLSSTPPAERDHLSSTAQQQRTPCGNLLLHQACFNFPVRRKSGPVENLLTAEPQRGYRYSAAAVFWTAAEACYEGAARLVHPAPVLPGPVSGELEVGAFSNRDRPVNDRPAGEEPRHKCNELDRCVARRPCSRACLTPGLAGLPASYKKGQGPARGAGLLGREAAAVTLGLETPRVALPGGGALLATARCARHPGSWAAGVCTLRILLSSRMRARLTLGRPVAWSRRHAECAFRQARAALTACLAGAPVVQLLAKTCVCWAFDRAHRAAPVALPNPAPLAQSVPCAAAYLLPGTPRRARAACWCARHLPAAAPRAAGSGQSQGHPAPKAAACGRSPLALRAVCTGGARMGARCRRAAQDVRAGAAWPT